MLRRTCACVALVLAASASAAAVTAPPAAALNPIKPVCGVAGLVSGLIGKACTVIQNGGRWTKAGKKLLGGHIGGAAKTVLGNGAKRAASAATATVGFAAIAAGVLGGAKLVLGQTATVLDHTTSPQLGSSWFSSLYWRIAGISALLTLPFLFAAAIQALIRADLALLVRATFGYLPLAMLAVSVAAPITMLLLAASDQLSSVVSSAAGDASTHFLRHASLTIGTLTVASGSPFLAILVGLFIVGGAFALWIELLMREAAVYVIVLMLPLAFAAFVWPARRIWAIRAVELLAALILSKFAIVAVLSLGSAALTAGTGHGLTSALAGVVLLIMGAFAPWALLRLLPLAELASSAAGSLRSQMRGGVEPSLEFATGSAHAGEEWAASTTAQMGRDALDAAPNAAAADPPVPEASRSVAPPGPSSASPNGSHASDAASDGLDAKPDTSNGGADASDAGADASDATPGPPARNEGLAGSDDGVRAPGGQGVAVPGDAQKSTPSGEQPMAATGPAASATAPAPEYETDEPSPAFEDLWRDDHRDVLKPDLGDAPPPPEIDEP
jgi:hypothetical protein